MYRIVKFGGTSVGSAERMRTVADIVLSRQHTVTVLSAMSGVTDMLTSLIRHTELGERPSIRETIDSIELRHRQLADELLTLNHDKGIDFIDYISAGLRQECNNYDPYLSPRVILSKGELLSSTLFSYYLLERGIRVRLLHAPDYIVKKDDGQLSRSALKKLAQEIDTSQEKFYVTQGFICTGADGNIDNLGRGGSDYTAALAGAALDADRVEIWTDIDGMHNNDPRYVGDTRPIRRMTFGQAAELAYFGAKIIHPATIQPCKDKGIEVWLKNTLEPEAEGTVISGEAAGSSEYLAVAAKDGITVIRIRSARMLMAYGFLRRVFEIFEKHRTPIDMITTSEVSVALTIDDAGSIEDLAADLKMLGDIEVEHNNSIVCVVGDLGQQSCGRAARVLGSLQRIPIKMISYGATRESMALLADTCHKKVILQRLNEELFS